MHSILDLAAKQHGRGFVTGCMLGTALTFAGVYGFSQFGLFPKESEALILSADYRLSRTEFQLREEVRYLQRELTLLRRARSNMASYPSDSRS